MVSKKIKIRTNQPDCVLIFDPEKDFFHELNPSASELFIMIQKKISEEKIIAHLIYNYDISKKDAAKYLKSLIKDLVKLGIAFIKNQNKKHG